jgi:polar amino acid transport system substrate-binding protein
MGRVAAFLLVVLAVAATAVTVASGGNRTHAAAGACADNVVNPGSLTVGTDNPAYPPWFGGAEKKPWKVSNPASGKGYESAVVYAVAKQLGFAASAVNWTYVPFSKSFAPGKKSFDFDINQISFTPARAKVVTFSASYYDVNQAIVVLKGTSIANVKTKAGL